MSTKTIIYGKRCGKCGGRPGFCTCPAKVKTKPRVKEKRKGKGQIMFNKELSKALGALTEELRLTREERKRQCVTKVDLQGMEGRILAAITPGISADDQRLLDRLLAQTRTSLKRMEELDARTA